MDKLDLIIQELKEKQEESLFFETLEQLDRYTEKRERDTGF